MSEKRFTDIWCSETGHIGVTDYGTDKEFTSSEFEDFLNELNEENQRLKNDCSILVQSNQEYRKENEQLKKERREEPMNIGEVVELLNELSTSCRQLEREVKSLNAFLVHKGFAEEYIRWKKDSWDV